MITLERFCYSPMGVFGKLTVNDFTCFTVEKPWANNRPNESCIPEGNYQLRLRESPVVKRTSGGSFSEGWEVTHVPGREWIMLHPGNTKNDVQGCIAVGNALGVVNNLWAVINSRKTFDQLMAALEGSTSWDLKVIRGTL